MEKDYQLLRQKIVEYSLNLIRMASILRRKPMPWDLTWFPTYKCNLACTYCNSNPGKIEKANPEKALRKIIALHPSSISILGGEPFILDGMIDYLQRLHKELPQSFILITTNGMINGKLLIASLPYLKTMCISIDGLGEYQKKYRQGKPDFIIKNLKAVVAEKNLQNYNMNIVVNAVLSKHNAQHLPEFFEYIHEIDENIVCFAQAMQPFDSPESIASYPELTREFIKKIMLLKKRGFRVQLVGRLAVKKTRRLDVVGENIDLFEENVKDNNFRFFEQVHTCYQEAFNTYITAAGQVYTCRLYAAVNQVKGLLHEAYVEKNIKRILSIYWNYFKEFVIDDPTFQCTRFSGCPEWMNDIILSKSPDEFPPEIFRVAGRLTNERIMKNTSFIKRKINPQFKKSFIEKPPENDVLRKLLIPENNNPSEIFTNEN